MKTYFKKVPTFSYFKDNTDTIFQRVSYSKAENIKTDEVCEYDINEQVIYLFDVPIVKPKCTVYQNKKGQRHRLDGPAVRWINGMEQWFKNGVLHRLDGPAVFHPRFPTRDSFHINGTKYHSYFEYLVAVELFKQKQLTLA